MKQWQKVKGSAVWRPTKRGAEIVGRYVGRVKHEGQYGSYESIIIDTRTERHLVRGVAAISIFDANPGLLGHVVKIVFAGSERFFSKTDGCEHVMKMYDVYEEVDTIDVEAPQNAEVPL